MLTQQRLHEALSQANTDHLLLGIGQRKEGYTVSASAAHLVLGEQEIARRMNQLAVRLRRLGLRSTKCKNLTIIVSEKRPKGEQSC